MGMSKKHFYRQYTVHVAYHKVKISPGTNSVYLEKDDGSIIRLKNVKVIENAIMINFPDNSIGIIYDQFTWVLLDENGHTNYKSANLMRRS